MRIDLEYKLEIFILSEAIFSSGEKEHNLVQTKVLADQDGFVYFHAKTLKGQLKRQAFWLLEQYKSFDENRAKEFFASVVKLFGINNTEINAYCPDSSKKDYHQQQGIMQLSNLELNETVRRYFNSLKLKKGKEGYCNISAHDLIEAQTNIRTGIQLENGVTKNKMMTTYHTVKEGLYFYGTLHFSENVEPYLQDLKRIIYSFKRMGAGIHRGRGEVEAKLYINDVEAPIDWIKEGDYCD